MKWREEVKEYFRFSRKDRVAIWLLTVLILALYLLPSVWPRPVSRSPDNAEIAWMDSLARLADTLSTETRTPVRSWKRTGSDPYARAPSYPGTPGELFYFDPNTLPVSGWEKLGLRPRTIQTIQNYLSRGGRFRKTEDLRRIYGLREEDYLRLAPYVKLAGQPTDPTQSPSPLPAKEIPKPRLESIDINMADSLQWVALPGIGPKLALRIIHFRDKLGGFYAPEQVGETYGLPDSTFQRIRGMLKMEGTVFRKININKATLEELKAHPYIRWELARPIIAYREQHGPFGKLDDLKQVMAVTEDWYRKIAPYLATGDQ